MPRFTRMQQPGLKHVCRQLIKVPAVQRGGEWGVPTCPAIQRERARLAKGLPFPGRGTRPGNMLPPRQRLFRALFPAVQLFRRCYARSARSGALKRLFPPPPRVVAPAAMLLLAPACCCYHFAVSAAGSGALGAYSMEVQCLVLLQRCCAPPTTRAAKGSPRNRQGLNTPPNQRPAQSTTTQHSAPTTGQGTTTHLHTFILVVHFPPCSPHPPTQLFANPPPSLSGPHLSLSLRYSAGAHACWWYTLELVQRFHLRLSTPISTRFVLCQTLLLPSLLTPPSLFPSFLIGGTAIPTRLST